MQFKVPQNITMEDRIAGPFTAIQFGILVIGGGLAFFAYTSNFFPPANQIIGIFLALLTAVLAIGRFNDQPMYRFIRFMIAFVVTPRTRIWHKAQDVQLIKPTAHSTEDGKPKLAKSVSKQDIARLAVVLDTHGASGQVPKVSAPVAVPKPPDGQK